MSLTDTERERLAEHFGQYDKEPADPAFEVADAVNASRETPEGHTYSDAQLATAVRHVTEDSAYKHVSKRTYKQLSPDDYPSASTIERRFGTWPEAVAAAFPER